MLSFFGKAAAASAMLQMPEGSVQYLKDRFADDTVSDEPVNLPASDFVVAPPPTEQEPSAPEPVKADPDLEDFPEPGESPPIDSIPEQNRGTITEQTFSADQSGLYLSFGAGFIKNSTNFTNDEALSFLQKPLELKLEQTDEPQVLIVHTHATESYEPYDRSFCDTSYTWRSTNNLHNVVFLGDIITKQLRDAGIAVIHDSTQHDYPSYNGAYDRSAATIRKWLDLYPTIKVVIDVHRDALEYSSGNLAKPVSLVAGKKTAQVMIISGCDDGSMNMPRWEENFRFAAALQNTMESDYPGLTRPVYFCYRKYNMDLTTGSLLIEFGGHGNTLTEASRAALYTGKSLAKMLLQTLET